MTDGSWLWDARLVETSRLTSCETEKLWPRTSQTYFFFRVLDQKSFDKYFFFYLCLNFFRIQRYKLELPSEALPGPQWSPLWRPQRWRPSSRTSQNSGGDRRGGSVVLVLSFCFLNSLFHDEATALHFGWVMGTEIRRARTVGCCFSFRSRR